MEWIQNFYDTAVYYPKIGYKELIVRLEKHITEKVLTGFFYRIKREIIRDVEPEQISFRDGSPIITFLVDDDNNEVSAAISYKTGVNLDSNQLERIDEIACEYLRFKTPEELKAAKEKARQATAEFHGLQIERGFEADPYEIKRKKEQKKRCEGRNYLKKIDGRKPFCFNEVKRLYSDVLLFRITEHLYYDKRIDEGQNACLEKGKKDAFKFNSITLSYSEIDFNAERNGVFPDQWPENLLYVPGCQEPWLKKGHLNITLDGKPIAEDEIDIEIAEFIYNKVRLNKYSIGVVNK